MPATSRSFTLSFGKLVSLSLRIFFRNALPFLALAVLVLFPWGLVRVAMADLRRPELVALLGLGSIALASLLGNILTATVTFGVVRQMQGQPATFGETIAHGVRSLGTAIGTGFVCGLRIGVMFLLLVIPGVIEAVRLSVALPAAIIERRGIGHAIERSKALTLGSRWPIFGAGVLVQLATMGLAALATFALVSATGKSPDAERTQAWVEVVFMPFTTTFGATMYAVCYAMLREGKENVDAKQLAAVFA